MLDIKRLRNEPDEIKKALERRGIEAPLDEFAELDRKRREIIVEVEENKEVISAYMTPRQKKRLRCIQYHLTF